jgi:hypothetical protein
MVSVLVVLDAEDTSPVRETEHRHLCEKNNLPFFCVCMLSLGGAPRPFEFVDKEMFTKDNVWQTRACAVKNKQHIIFTRALKELQAFGSTPK